MVLLHEVGRLEGAGVPASHGGRPKYVGGGAFPLHEVGRLESVWGPAELGRR